MKRDITLQDFLPYEGYLQGACVEELSIPSLCQEKLVLQDQDFRSVGGNVQFISTKDHLRETYTRI